MRRLALTLGLALSVGCDRQAASVASTTATRQAVCGQATDETVRMMRGLAPVCEGCHQTGTRAYFSSVSSFQNLIVSDPRLVKPGDPDGSELVRLLEARSNGAFTQMPPGTRTYAELVGQGAATLSVEEVKRWVRELGNQTPGRDARPDPAATRISRVRAEQVQRALYQQLGLGYADFFTDAPEFGIPMAQPSGDDRYPLQPADVTPAPRTGEPRERFHGLGGGSVHTQQKADLSLSPTFALTLTQVSQRWCRLGYLKAGNLALFPAGTTKDTDATNVKVTIRRWFQHFHGTSATAGEVDALYDAVWLGLAPGGAEAGFVGLCSTFIRHPDWIFF